MYNELEEKAQVLSSSIKMLDSSIQNCSGQENNGRGRLPFGRDYVRNFH